VNIEYGGKILHPKVVTLRPDYTLLHPYSIKLKRDTPWPEFASELYRPSDRRLSVKLVPNYADRGCHAVSATEIEIFSPADMQRRFEETFYFHLQSKRISQSWREVGKRADGPISCRMLRRSCYQVDVTIRPILRNLEFTATVCESLPYHIFKESVQQLRRRCSVTDRCDIHARYALFQFKKKRFWEEQTVCFPFVRNGPHTKRVQRVLYCCTCILYKAGT
jgi:hypothetical protein